jgi:hypothetical protein
MLKETKRVEQLTEAAVPGLSINLDLIPAENHAGRLFPERAD